MAPYDPARSPSLRKMEGPGSRKSVRSRPRLSIGNVIGDPFALATVSISILAWLLAFVSSVISDVDSHKYPNFAWWTLVYMFFCIIGITVTFASDTVHTYHVAIVGFLAAGLTFTTSATNQLIYSPQGAMEAAAAGFILLSMIAIVWMLYFGSQPQASHRAFVDSFALHKGDKPSSRSSRQMSNRYMDQQNSTYPSNAAPQMYNSAQLNGFETSSPSAGYQAGQSGLESRSSRFGGPTASSQILNTTAGPGNSSMAVGGDSDVSAPTDYPYRARAIYSYEANPDDVNEISFTKHEILEVSDVSGRWWQAKKSTGETGIAPSNYLILL